MNNLKVLAPVILVGCALAESASGTCHNSDLSEFVRYEFVAPGPLVVDAAAPDGALLGEIVVPSYPVGAYSVFCSGAIGNFLNSSPYPSAGYQLYDVGIPGISMQIEVGATLPYVSNHWWTSTISGANPEWVYLRFFKNGTITRGGVMPAGEVMTGYLMDWDYLGTRMFMNNSIRIVPQPPTCTPTLTDKLVNLPPWNFHEFDGSGRTAKHDFSLELDCRGGEPGIQTGIHVTLTDQSSIGNRGSLLGLSSASTARGVGLELHNRHGIVQYGPASSAAGNDGQWFDGETGNGLYSIPLSVNLAKTGAPLQPGTIRANAIYTLRYE